MSENYTAVYGSTIERDLRSALLRQDNIKLTPPANTDTGTVDCSAFVGNYQWLRLTFTGAKYTYYFDSTKGWYYLENNKSEDGLSQRVSDLEDSLEAKEDKIVTVLIVNNGDVDRTIDPDKEYNFAGNLTSLTVRLGGETPGNSHYRFFFETQSDVISLTIYPECRMPDGFAIMANRRYECDIYKGYVSIPSWSTLR